MGGAIDRDLEVAQQLRDPAGVVAMVMGDENGAQITAQAGEGLQGGFRLTGVDQGTALAARFTD